MERSGHMGVFGALEELTGIAFEILQWWQSTNETFGHTLMEKEKYIFHKGYFLQKYKLKKKFILSFHPPIFIRILEYRIKKRWMETPRCA